MNNIERAISQAKEKGVMIFLRHPKGEDITIIATSNLTDRCFNKVVTKETLEQCGDGAVALAIENAMEEALHNEN